MVMISVIVAIYNDELFLDRCIKSILNQSFTDFELICINDGSTDATLQMLKKYQECDKRIVLISTSNYNAGHARNLGLKIARGKYLLFLDADDFFEPDLLSKSLERITVTNSDMCVFRSNTYNYGNNTYEDTPWTINKNLLPGDVFAPSDVKKDIFKLFVGWAWDKLILKELIDKNGLEFQEQRTTNDMYFVFSAVLSCNQICILEDILVHHQRGYSSLANTREKSWQCFISALFRVKQFLEDHGIYGDRQVDFINYVLHAALWNLNTLKPPFREELYNMLKNKLFDELGVGTLPKTNYYNQKEFDSYTRIMKLTYSEYYGA